MTEQKTEQTAMQSTTMPLTVALFMCLSVSEHDLPQSMLAMFYLLANLVWLPRLTLMK